MRPKGRKFYLKHWLPVLFFIMFSLPVVINAEAIETHRNILIINSYHKGLSWTDDQTDGITSILKNSETRCAIYTEYMDWKNYPTLENLNQMYSYLKYKYSNKPLDLIITTDDAALEFALKNRTELFSNAPVVFSGVNYEGVQKITQGYSRVSGIIEQINPEKTIKAALKINPELKEVYVVFDNTESGLSTGALTIQTLQKQYPDIKVSPLTGRKTEDVINQVGQVSGDSIILITTYYIEGEGVTDGFEDFCRMVSAASKVPVYDLYDFGIGNGIIGGSMLSGRSQGENAGKLAVKILEGEDIWGIQELNTARYIFDFRELQRFGIPLSRVPKGSEIINNPFTFFETYRTLVITVLVIFILLVLFICILLFYLRKINKMKQKLSEKNEELTQLYEELTDNENELRQQFDELVTMQQALVTSENRYSLLFEKMLNGFFILEPVLNRENKLIDIRFINVNPGFENQIGLSAVKIIGRTWMEVFGYPNQDLAIYQNVLQTGEAVSFETYYSEADIYYRMNAFKINEQQVGIVFDNITEYKLAIKEIKKLNEELEQRVKERTRELQSAIHELESFTYTVSHDLKSPLRAVDGYSRIIFEDFGDKLSDEVTEIITHIRSICKDMIEMIDKLLQYSTTSKTETNKEEIYAEEMFLKIFNELRCIHLERDIRLVIETGLPKIYADRIMISQVIYNLISNSIKFTRNRDKSIIKIGCTITEDEYIFYVKDNGVGFDMEFSGKLFGIFQRLHTTDEFEGSGIGLVTVKKIIQKHGGKAWIEGKSGVGATAYFTLPFA